MSQVTELLEALTQLAWPLIAGVLLWKLFPAVKAVITSRAFSVKIADMEVTVQDATEQFRVQIEDLQKQVILLRSGRQPVGPALGPGANPAPVASARRSSILWVDDKPTNNALEIAQLKERGIDVVQALSTEDAMAILNNSLAFDAIISDMGRREPGGYRAQAGLVLLNAVRRAGYDLPFLVYSSPNHVARNHEEVKSAGGDGATASALELLEWINEKTK